MASFKVDDYTLCRILAHSVDNRLVQEWLEDVCEHRFYPLRRFVDPCTTIPAFSLVCRRWAQLICRSECWENLELFIRRVPVGNNLLHKWCCAWRSAKLIVPSTMRMRFLIQNHCSQNEAAVSHWAPLVELHTAIGSENMFTRIHIPNLFRRCNAVSCLFCNPEEYY